MTKTTTAVLSEQWKWSSSMITDDQYIYEFENVWPTRQTVQMICRKAEDDGSNVATPHKRLVHHVECSKKNPIKKCLLQYGYGSHISRFHCSQGVLWMTETEEKVINCEIWSYWQANFCYSYLMLAHGWLNWIVLLSIPLAFVNTNVIEYKASRLHMEQTSIVQLLAATTWPDSFKGPIFLS